MQQSVIFPYSECPHLAGLWLARGSVIVFVLYTPGGIRVSKSFEREGSETGSKTVKALFTALKRFNKANSQ
jgi:hypothetical protein